MPHPPSHTVTVTYNGSSPWVDPYTPFVSMSFEPVEFGGTWANVRTITLDGSVAVSKSGNLETVKNAILSTFSVNGKTLVISGGGTETFHNVFVDSISFPMSKYIGKLDYSITLRAYDFASMTGNSGASPILSPSDTVSADTQSNGAILVTHTVSAQGVDELIGGDNGMDNAKAFVWARIVVVPMAALGAPNFVSGSYLVMEETENFNRLTSTYSMTRSYLFDGIGGGSGEATTFKRYSVTVDESLEADAQTVSIDAEYRGGRNTAVGDLQTATETESVLYGVAQTQSGLTLNPAALSMSIDEDPDSKMVRVQASFDNNSCFSGGSFFDYEVSVDTDYITGITKVDVNGELIVRGTLDNRNTVIDAFVSGNNVPMYLWGLGNSSYGAVDGGLPYTLNQDSDSVSITRNETKGTLRISASFNDEDFISGYSAADWSANVTSSIPYAKTSPSATVNGYWSIQYFNFTTNEKLSASASLTMRDDLSTWPSMPIDASPATVRSQAMALKNSVIALTGGAYYVVSESENVKGDSSVSASVSEERSFLGGNVPLISLGVGPPPF